MGLLVEDVLKRSARVEHWSSPGLDRRVEAALEAVERCVLEGVSR